MDPRQNVQKAAVRVIASELDRRSATLEQAIRDLRTQMADVAANSAARNSAIDQLQLSVNTLSAAQERISNRLDLLTGRITAGEHADIALDDAVRALRFDHDATTAALQQLQSTIAQMAVVERVSHAELP